MHELVVIVDYDPQWPVLFEEEKHRILEAVDGIVSRIEHIGSTAVKGLGAKPIIDIMVAIPLLGDAAKCIKPLMKIDYEYVPEFEDEIPERRYFRKGQPPTEQRYHLHMVELNSDFWKKQLLFRDYLRNHPEVAMEYYELKKKLAAEHGSDHEGYTNAKKSFIESIVEKAERKKR